MCDPDTGTICVMRVTLTKGSPGCLQQLWGDLPFGGGGPHLTPVAGSPFCTFTLRAANAAGRSGTVTLSAFL